MSAPRVPRQRRLGDNKQVSCVNAWLLFLSAVAHAAPLLSRYPSVPSFTSPRVLRYRAEMSK